MTSRDPQRVEVVVLIGDVVDSRSSADRRALHRALQDALDGTNTHTDPIEPLEITVGDEFQGVYPTVGAALDAAFRTRLALLPTADTRYGIGRGASTTLDAGRGIKDGPAWWAAREAITEVEAHARRGALDQVRTAYAIADQEPRGKGARERHGESDVAQAVNAALHCQDHMVGSLSERSTRLLKGLLDGMTQRDLAQAEGISPSAVSQRVRGDGLAVIMRSHELLGEMT